MTYRGKVQNGTVVLPDAVELPDGTIVDVIPVADAARLTSGNGTSTELPCFGIWSDRFDDTDSTAIAAELRRKSESRQ